MNESQSPAQNDALVLGEKYPSKLSAVFADEQSALAAREQLLHSGNLSLLQVDLLRPEAVDAVSRVEPETRGTLRTLVRAHLAFGIVGSFVGAALAAFLLFAGFAIATSSPLMTFLALAFFGAMSGLMVGGLVGLRPDHDSVVTAVRRSVNDGNWTLLVHARSHAELEKIRALLEAHSAEIAHSW